MRFGKEETSTEDKKPCLQGFVPSWSFLTRLRRPYLFPCAGKDMEEKGAWGYGVHAASEFRQAPIFQASFHTIVTLRVSDYAPPDTREPGLRAVAFEYLQSIEGAGRICWSAPFCGEGLCSASTERTPMASPMRGSCRRRRLMRWTAPRRRKCLHLIRHGLRRATFPS